MITSSLADITPTFQKIDQIQDTAELLNKVRTTQVALAASLLLSPELYKGKPTGRSARWYGIQAQVRDDGKSWQTFEATEPIEFWLFLAELRDQYYTEANSIAVCQYTGNANCIPGYNDPAIFNKKVVLINLIDAPQKLQRDKVSVQFHLDKQVMPFNDGDAVAIDPVSYGRPPSGAQASPTKGKVASPTAAAGTNSYLIQLRVLEM